MEDPKLLETVADIAYYAGYKQFTTGDSRADVLLFITWAREFEQQDQGREWTDDYITKVEDFVSDKILSET